MFHRAPFFVALCLASSTSCFACATIAVDPVRTTDESALIVWNAQTQTEQFVRRASFETTAKNFAFLVPTPSRPKLSAADETLFPSLQQELEPKTVVQYQRGVKLGFWLGSLGGRSSSDDESTAASSAVAGRSAFKSVNSVEVIEQKQVGNYKAVILRADDATALAKWLRKHRYPIGSETREWLAPYVARGFYLTVFQISGAPDAGSAQANAVNLTFQTDAPFYPYRETRRAQKTGGGRSLRVFLVSGERMAGTISNGKRTLPWKAATTYAAPLDVKVLCDQKLEVPAGALRLTALEDDSSPRPGWGDLSFAPDRDQTTLTPPPHIVVEDARHWVPIEALVFGLGGLLWASSWVWKATRRAKAEAG